MVTFQIYDFGIIALVLLGFLVMDWHARLVFIARAYCRRYGHGKSWKRASKHYKTNWSFFQRILWIHTFKEHYEDKYMTVVYLSYFHAAFSVITIGCFLIDRFLLTGYAFWHYIFVVFAVFTILRFVYDNAVVKSK